MARLIPDFISEDCKSNAERRLFERCRDELPPEFTVLHSLGVARHDYKLVSEADFVLVSPEIVMVIEVKGGRVARRDGAWFFINRYGDMKKRKESPMQQASSVTAALRNSVRDHFGYNSPQKRVAFGYATFFPDIPFQEQSPEWDLRRIYDLGAWCRPLREVLADAIAYSRAEMERTTGYKPHVLSDIELTDLVQFLRGDFEKVPSLTIAIEGHEQQRVRLEPRQYAVLDQLGKNPRMVIEGPAGTGKTLLAIECARRHAAQGRRVLFVCFNRLLADHLNLHAAGHGLAHGVCINTLHGHCLSVITAAALDVPTGATDRELYQTEIPRLVPVAVSLLTGFKPWDVLIVDEGQDLAAHPPFVAALDRLFAGGFSGGRWSWFEDPRQRILHQTGHALFDLGAFAPIYFQLNKNWRNTDEVATFASIATLTPLPELSGIIGPTVKTVVCDNCSDRMKLQVLITDILNQGAVPNQIVLLSAVAEEKALFASIDFIAGKKRIRYKVDDELSNAAIRSASVYRFKGLEAKIIVLTDLHDLRSEEGRMAAYVGMSRATSALYVLLSHQAYTQFEANRLDFADTVDPRPIG
jgi:hypothetical protein